MPVTEERIREALTQVRFPGLKRDIVSFGMVEGVVIDGGEVKLRLNIPTGSPTHQETIARECHEAVMALEGVEKVSLEVMAPQSKGARPSQHTPPPGPPAGPAAAATSPLAAAGRLPTGHMGPGSQQPGRPPRPGGPQGPQPGRGGPQGPAPEGRPAALYDRTPIPGVKHVIAVASGKGGVGKSTVASNLAIALSQLGEKVGLMDADIYGPSVPTMLGTHEEPVIKQVNGKRMLEPIDKFGIKLMSLGFIQPEDDPVIWRGPIVMKAVRQFLRDVDWTGADILLIDLPPGTGDAQLTLTQSAPLTGAVIVTTPQDVALIDARKGLRMFQEVDVPVLGLVENMAVYHCPECGHQEHIFRADGGRRTAEALDVPFLGSLPIDPAIARAGDEGTPYVANHPDGPVADTFRKIAQVVLESARRASGEESAETVN